MTSADPAAAIQSALRRESDGIVLIVSPDNLATLDALVEEVRDLAALDGRDAVRSGSVEEALAHPHKVVLLVPENESETAEDLTGLRNMIVHGAVRRSAPVVLFLLRSGDGLKALSELPSLRGLIDGSVSDPEALASIDPAAERADFQQRHGMTPEAWLEDWRNGDLPETNANHRVAFDAALLEEG